MDSVTNSVDVNMSKLWEIVRTVEPGVLQPMGSQKVGHDLVTEQQLQPHEQILRKSFCLQIIVIPPHIY